MTPLPDIFNLTIIYYPCAISSGARNLHCEVVILRRILKLYRAHVIYKRSNVLNFIVTYYINHIIIIM